MDYNVVQEMDFIIRTRKILKQYEELFRGSEIENYNVTLFFNCCVGLIIIPKQELDKELPTAIINQKEHGINPESIKFIIQGKKQFNFVAGHIRNSISHNLFTMINENRKIKQIDLIRFEDYYPNTETKTFEAEIRFEEIKKFALFLSNIYLKKLSKKNGYSDINSYMQEFYPNDVRNH